MDILDITPIINQVIDSLQATLITLSHGITYRFKMRGQGGSRGAARDLTTDSYFLMREANSPPQGTKRSGGNITTSTEKKNKPAPKEMTTPKRQFWFRFKMMKKLAIDEGAPLSYTPTPIHNLIRNGFFESEAKEFLKLVHSYPHMGQSFFPIYRPDGVTG